MNWDERYQTGDYMPREYPSSLLRNSIEWLPEGRALDIATGTGRNALYLAKQSYDVDAIDISKTAIEIAQKKATEQNLRVNWISADLSEYDFPKNSYDVIVGSFYYDLNVLSELIDALKQGGVLLYEHHLQPSNIADRGPESNRLRFRSNELLQMCLNLTILDYRERVRIFDSGDRAGESAQVATIIARNDRGEEMWYPPE